MAEKLPRLLVLGAHPDDAEYAAGGLIATYRQRGCEVKLVSVTNGESGHHERRPAELIAMRRAEAAAAGRVVGSPYETWDFPDGALQPNLEVRRRIIREIRSFAPDLVLTHRPNDYHPDHRAVGQAVQDASYMVIVPNVVPETPALRKDPIVAYMADLFTKPCPLAADVVLDITEHVEVIVNMLACHRSQVFEWLPYADCIEDQLPEGEAERLAWLREWFTTRIAPRADRYRSELVTAYGAERGERIRCAEVYEISEYAGTLEDAQRRWLFPFASK